MRRVGIDLAIFFWDDVQFCRRYGTKSLFMLRNTTDYTILSICSAARIFEYEMLGLDVVYSHVSETAIDIVQLKHEEVGLILRQVIARR